MKIYCCGCSKEVKPRLTSGKEIYPHRKDLVKLPFWKCDDCGNYVGCHHKTKDRTRPLGNIPTPALRIVRKQIHATLDPLWKEGHLSGRQELYARISSKLGYTYHAGEITSLEEADKVVVILQEILKELGIKED